MTIITLHNGTSTDYAYGSLDRVFSLTIDGGAAAATHLRGSKDSGR